MAAALELLLEEIIMNILKRLPVKSLVRFKCVCKSWRSLINDPYFIRNQVNHVNSMDTTNTENGCERQIFTTDVRGRTTFHCMEIYKRRDEEEEECDHQDHTNGDTPIAISVKDLDFPWHVECGTVEIRGCCDGLLCLVNGYRGLISLLIWNPSINECKSVPYPPSYGWDLDAYGIGYDSSLDDYKVLKVPSKATINHTSASSVFVFASKSNSWKHIQDNFPYYLNDHPFCATFTNGGIHWLATLKHFKETSIIVYFDVVGEKFGEVSLPHQRDGDNDGWFEDLQLLGKKLCLAWFSRGCDKLDLWVMEEYKVRESWTKLLTVPLSEGLDIFDYPFCFMRTDIVVFMGAGEFFMYSTRDQSLRRFHIGVHHRVYDTKITYRETLVSPGPSVAMEY